jgi:hypothetical protein
MNPEAIKENIQAVIDGLTPLAENLGVVAGKLYEYALHRVLAGAVINSILAIVFTITFFVSLRWAKKLISRRDEDGDHDENDLIPGVILAVVSTIMFFSAIGCINMAVKQFVAPELSAIKFLIDMVSGSNS